jgi:DNA-binding MarR family transcriptional regulator
MDDLYRLPGHLIRRLQQAAVSIFMAEIGEAGQDLTPVQFGALVVTKKYPGLDQATLAGLIAYDRTTIGGVVDRLVQKGLILRVVSDQDRRARELRLSQAGECLLDQIIPRVEHVQQIILSGLDRVEQEQFLALLQKVTESLNDRSRAPLRVPTKHEIDAT